MKKTTFLVIRHGQTLWNKEGRMMGVSDIPLTPEGIVQAKKAAFLLKDYTIDVIATSPLTRASQTAQIIAGYHPKAMLLTLADLHERSFGELEGLPYEEANARYPQMTMGTWWHYPNFRPPGGENLADVTKRAQRALDKLTKNYEGQTIAIVSHGAFIRNLFTILLNLPREEINSYGFDNASVSIVRYSREHGGEAHILNKIPD